MSCSYTVKKIILKIEVQLKPHPLKTCFCFSNESVMFLECDVGQAEFTVATVISLHCITCTVSGPAYSHLTTPTKLAMLRNRQLIN